MKILFASAFIFVAVVFAAAQSEQTSNPIDADLEKCLQAKHATIPRAECYSAAFANWEKDVDTTFAALRSKLSPAQSAKLADSQTKWTKYRDAEFAFIQARYQDKRGTGYIAARLIARIDVVKPRAVELEELLAYYK